MSGRFTPADVVARYRELGARPVKGSMGISNDEGTWTLRPDMEACALGVMLHDHKSLEYEFRRDAVGRVFGVEYTSFYTGFDGGDYGVAQFRGKNWWREEDYLLGVACREAVEREIGPLGG